MATKRKGSRRLSKVKKEAMRKARVQLWAIIFLTFGAFFFLLSMIAGESGWQWMHHVLFGLFGWCGYLIGPVLFYLSYCASRDKLGDHFGLKLTLTTVMLALIAAAAQIFGAGMPNVISAADKLSGLYASGLTLDGGGVFAAVIGFPLMNLGSPGDKISVLLLIFVLGMVLTGTTIPCLFGAVKKPMQKMGDAYQERLEERKAAVEDHKAASPKYNIDIPLDTPVQRNDSKRKTNQPEDDVSRSKEKLMHVLADEADPEHETVVKIPDEGHQLYIDDIIKKKSPDAEQPEAVKPTAQAPLYIAPEGGADQNLPGQLTFDPQAKPVAPTAGGYKIPPISLLRAPVRQVGLLRPEEIRENEQRLVNTLKSFGVETRVIATCTGPAVTRYELQPSAGVKISRITGLADDIALNLAASGVRIEAPIPNKAAVGIEIPNKVVCPVTLREAIDSKEFYDAKSRVTVALGRDVSGNVTVADIAKMPHLLIAGATGSGKSVCINAMIMSLLYKSTPDDVKLLLIDPKVVELGAYNGIPQLLVPVVTDPKKAAGALGWAVSEMLKRYQLFAQHGVKDLGSFNNLAKKQGDITPLYHIVIIIDELSDLMMAAPNDVEDYICRLAQMARAAGMHLVIATQRPSVDVITGVIKANIPSRIAFAVSSQVDSRTILDMGGAEKLLGAGDMLFYPVGSSKPLRIQGCYVADEEIDRVINYIKSVDLPQYDQQIIEDIDKHAPVEKGAATSDGGGFSDDDELLPAAIECVVEAGLASTSLLQRRLKLGYARAARIVDELESRGIVGPFEGSKPRQVLITRDRWIEMKMKKEM